MYHTLSGFLYPRRQEDTMVMKEKSKWKGMNVRQEK